MSLLKAALGDEDIVEGVSRMSSDGVSPEQNEFSDQSQEVSSAPEPPVASRPPLIAATIVALSIVAIAGLSVWYLMRPQPLLIQGEADATRIDIAARVDGRLGSRSVSRGDNVAADDVLLTIDNPQLIARLKEAEAAKIVAEADLTRIQVGTRAERIDERKAAIAAAAADLTLAQQNYDRTRQLTQKDFAALQQLDQATASLDVATQKLEQANLAYKEAVAGYTAEERGVALANVAKAAAAIVTLRAQIDELTVKAPAASQVYQVSAELGEYVSPGVPLLSLIDLGDVWIRFDLREDLIKGLKVGDKINVHIPALGDDPIPVEVKTIATRGEYAGWRATRATGDFDLRTFEVRAYPVEPLPELRPGMSAYADWTGAR